MEKWIEVNPAYDGRLMEPPRDVGAHGVELSFYLRTDIGATSFTLFTGWLLPETVRFPYRVFSADEIQPTKLKWNSDFSVIKYAKQMDTSFGPLPVDLSYHSWEPQQNWHTESVASECNLSPTGTCYSDGSGLNAISVFDSLLREGHEGVWRELEEYYNSVFAEVAAQ